MKLKSLLYLVEFISFLQFHRHYRKLLQDIYTPRDVQGKIHFSKILAARNMHIYILQKATKNASWTKNVGERTSGVLAERGAILLATTQRYFPYYRNTEETQFMVDVTALIYF